MSNPSVYLENTIISYLASRPSRNLIAAAWQSITHDWWRLRRPEFDLYVSELVVAESSRGDPNAARRRLSYLESLPFLPITEEVERLARVMLERKAVPRQASADAVHIAISAVHGIDYLLTWNCTHIDNAEAKPKIREICLVEGHRYPEICTPHELMGEEDGSNPS